MGMEMLERDAVTAMDDHLFDCDSVQAYVGDTKTLERAILVAKEDSRKLFEICLQWR